MANFFKSTVINNLVVGLTAVTFTAAVAYPPQVHAVVVTLDLRAINFGVKAEKIFEKIKRAIDKGETNKSLDTCLILKTKSNSTQVWKLISKNKSIKLKKKLE